MLRFFFSRPAFLSVWDSISDWYRDSLIHDLLSYFSEHYFTLSFDHYDNFTVSDHAASTLQTTIFAFFLGFVIACGAVAHSRTKQGRFISKLIRNGCLSPEKAMTLSELGEFRNTQVRRELSRGVNLRKLVRCPEEEAYVSSQNESNNQVPDNLPEQNSSENRRRKPKEPPRYPMDFTKDRFYIPEELKHRAEVRYEIRGNTWLFFLGAVVLAVAVMLLFYRFLPDLFRFADNLISWASPKA